MPPQTSAQVRANLAKFFWDLRQAIQLSPHQAAVHVHTRPDVIQALEGGHFELLPAWPETARIVSSYIALAGVDSRPVLDVLYGILVQHASAIPAPAARPVARPQAERLRHAGLAIANGARRLPADALRQVRERPDRAFYAVSLPLALIILMLNSSVLEAAFEHVPRPVSRAFEDVRQFFQVQFAPVREGLRWIEVDDPRRRRGDKLR